MNETVKLLLSLSLSGSILAEIIFALKPLVKNRLSKSVQYYIWLVVLLRLLLPFSFEGSVMNNIFYGERTSVTTSTPEVVQPAEGTVGAEQPEKAGAEGNIDVGEYSGNTNRSINFIDIFNRYALYLWLLGTAVVLTSNLTGYLRFSKYLMKSNKPAGHEENRLLEELLKGRRRVGLMRNSFAATPLLIGIFRPCIIIPDNDFSESQLKNILFHELTHLRRFDIGVKWLTMLVASIHWFNPLMYFIKREVNHACELACDEGVIKNLSNEEKQSYGDTLISVVAEHKYPIGVLQATMCEEKRTLKERLIAIMKHRKKSRFVIIVSAVLLITVMTGAMFLGGGVGIGIGGSKPPEMYIAIENGETKTALIGAYSWSYLGRTTMTDTDHPINFQYKPENIVSVTANQQLVLGTQKVKLDRKYNFTLEELSVYKDKQPIDFGAVEPSYMNGCLYLQAPAEPGEYVYALTLNFKDRGRVTYGFVVRVDMATYDLAEISKHRTPYIGDNSKVSALVGLLPVPDNYFRQQYISMETNSKPYKLKVFYEPRDGSTLGRKWLISTYSMNSIMQRNALVLFSMIDNLDEVTFAFRNSQSSGELSEYKYDFNIEYSRNEIKAVYGNPTELGKDLNLLQAAMSYNQTPEKTRGEFIQLDKLPKEYTYQMAIENGDVVYGPAGFYNMQRLTNLYDVYKGKAEGPPYSLRITTFTIDGDAIIHDMMLDDRGTRLIVDSTRDKFGEQSINEYKVSDITRVQKDGETLYRINIEGNKGIFDFYVR